MNVPRETPTFNVDDGSRLLGIAEVALVLGIHEISVRRFVRLGELPHVRLGRRILVTSSALTTFVREHGGA